MKKACTDIKYKLFFFISHPPPSLSLSPSFLKFLLFHHFIKYVYEQYIFRKYKKRASIVTFDIQIILKIFLTSY